MPNISRRSFFRVLLGTTASAAVAVPLATPFLSRVWNGFVAFCSRKPKPLSNAEQEKIIAEALESKAGQMALAMAMVEPIRRHLEYQAIGRKLLLVDDLPPSCLDQYYS